jgi:hypothetical protein
MAYWRHRMFRSVTVGPFAIFFTNVNRVMALPGHSHFATVTLEFATRENGANRGFPAFGETYAAIQGHLRSLTERPFHDHTNEDIADALFAAFATWHHEAVDKWGGAFTLARLDLAVRGVPDKIGHADGFTVYRVDNGAPR